MSTDAGECLQFRMIEYTPEIMLGHLVMHDQLHMYRIEELWLTRDEFLH